MSSLTLLLLLIIFFVCNNEAKQQHQQLTSKADIDALYSLRESLGIRSKDWHKKANPCTNWTGVLCDSGRVYSLTLTGLHRSHLGRRFDINAVENLTNLNVFNGSGFPLLGPIPAALTAITSLSVLVLSGCSIDGSIPQSIGLLRNLTYLDISLNSLSGPLPESLAGISGLKSLKLNDNYLSGSLPDSLWYLPNLSFFDVSNNRLKGSFGNVVFSNISIGGEVFNISGNSYYGLICLSFSTFLQRFRVVDLSDNYFQGGYQQLNGLLSRNCFSDEENQRSSNECEKFYGDREVGECQRWKYVLPGVLCGATLIGVTTAFIVRLLMKSRGSAATQKGNSSFKRSGGVGELDVKSEPNQEAVVAQPSLPIDLSPSSAISIYLPAVGDSFVYENLVKATSGFSSRNLIKKGHSGNLYLGVLEDATKVVVKRISNQMLSRETYLAELNVFEKSIECSDSRLVPFIGHCLDSDSEKLLVYKHMPNGDLSGFLHKKPEQANDGMQSLDWITRLKVAIGIAEGLSFLHHDCSPPLVHRDIEASSILLDDKYEVRLGSMSEICTQQSDSHDNVFSRIFRPQVLGQGISGSSTATCAYDIYCMGKVLLELVTGKYGISGSNNTATNAWLQHTLDCIDMLDKESIKKILDPSLKVDEDHLEEVWAVAMIAKSCLSPKPSKRPLARYVVKALENPLKVMRIQRSTNLVWLRTSSSLRSWHGAFLGSFQGNSSEIASLETMQEQQTLGLSDNESIQADGSDNSCSRSRMSREIFPEP